ncbi:MAG: glycerol-3-phosphate 1-O-acyltransferase PlsY [Bacteroidota bacterium]
MVTLVLILILSYLVGSIPGSLWVGKWIYKVDLRKHGSGNPGATNAYRILGWKAGLLSTIVDMGKGFVAAGVIANLRWDALPVWLSGDQAWLLLALFAGIAAVLGHMFPVFARFKGGKGVNTAAGVLLAVTPLNMLFSFIAFCLVLWRTRYVSLSSMTAAATYPASLLLQKYVFNKPDVETSLIVFGVVLALVIIVAHRSNIKRLLAGSESRISWVKTPVSLENAGD